MDGLNPQAWRDFFTVAGTAAAALLGLVLVAISLHVEKVEGHPLLRNRARGSLQTLGLILVLSLAALMPGITAFWFGAITLVVEAAGLGLLVWGLWTANQQVGRLPLGVWLRSTSQCPRSSDDCGGNQPHAWQGPRHLPDGTSIHPGPSRDVVQCLEPVIRPGAAAPSNRKRAEINCASLAGAKGFEPLIT